MTDRMLPVQYQPLGEVSEARAELEKIREQVMEVLPSRVDPDRFLRVAARAIMSNPKLMQCTRMSILSAVHESAQLGLEPSGLLGSAYLVPYQVKVKMPHPTNPRVTVEESVLEAKLIPGYRGLIDLARRSGGIEAIWAKVVRQRDQFDYIEGSDPRIDHRPFVPDPDATDDEQDPGKPVGVYMVAVLTGGVRQIEWMSWAEVERIRKRSKAATSGPWVTDTMEMGRKTVVRRGSKYLPLSPEFMRALELDEEAERQAEAPTNVRAMPRATQMLIERRRGTTDAVVEDDTDANVGVAPGPSGAPTEPPHEVEPTPDGVSDASLPSQGLDSDGAPDEGAHPAVSPALDPSPAARRSDSTATRCDAFDPEKGACVRAPGHEGSNHQNKDRESWA